MPRINWVEVQGFRPFGKEPQKLIFGSDIAVVWAANSQGKTSFAEAIEFLLTGSTCRCELTASAQDEFADSLRNAHLGDEVAVVVSASLRDAAGNDHILKRTLSEDYGKKHGCSSFLEIDGQTADEKTLSTLGIALGDPPLAAPVLLQHTLAFLFSAKPQQRADYFKALLEVTDVESVRSLIAEAGSCLDPIDTSALQKLKKCAAMPTLGTALAEVEASGKPTEQLQKSLVQILHTLLTSAGEVSSGTQDEKIARLRNALIDRREKAFSLSGFAMPSERPFASIEETTWKELTSYLEAREKIAEETRRLAALYTQILSIPEVHKATSPLDCPVCLTKGALTPTRITAIEESLRQSANYRETQAVAVDALKKIRNAVSGIATEIESWCPQAINWRHKRRIKEKFQVPRMRELLGGDPQGLISRWVRDVRSLLKKRRSLLEAAKAVLQQIPARVEDIGSSETLIELKKEVGLLEDLRKQAAQILQDCQASGKSAQAPLKAEADKEGKTAGWEDFLALFDQRVEVEAALMQNQARRTARKDFEKALKEIDRANNVILEARFKSLSKEVADWWERLRPDEPTFFDSVSPRPKARRSIDFKVGLANSLDRKNAKIRDAIAVFSHSQLHCLGIAAFIARIIRDKVGFMVLDDPIISSDEDHRPHFMRTVIEQLLVKGVQVIVITQDHKTWVDLNELYSHKNIDAFQLSKELAGTVALKSSDGLAVMLSRAEPFVSSESPEFRKMAAERLRDAGERFCKEFLTKKRRDGGDASALITDYDGKTLGQLIPLTHPHLVLDASHPGKLKTMEKHLNPGKHDDTPPSKGELQCALGDLKRFKKDYL